MANNILDKAQLGIHTANKRGKKLEDKVYALKLMDLNLKLSNDELVDTLESILTEINIMHNFRPEYNLVQLHGVAFDINKKAKQMTLGLF